MICDVHAHYTPRNFSAFMDRTQTRLGRYRPWLLLARIDHYFSRGS